LSRLGVSRQAALPGIAFPMIWPDIVKIERTIAKATNDPAALRKPDRRQTGKASPSVVKLQMPMHQRCASVEGQKRP
jgi:hypothetical protein